MKVCVITTGAAAAEPRATKQALALKRAWPNETVILFDTTYKSTSDPAALVGSDIVRQTRVVPTRETNASRLAVLKAASIVARAEWRARRWLRPAFFGPRAIGLASALTRIEADVIVVHGLEALLPAYASARRTGAKLVFDSMEYYSGMGDGQTSTEVLAARQLQAEILPHCALVLAASDEIADALEAEYKIHRPVPLYNTPPKTFDLPPKADEMGLYWRNYQVGFGQRGLDDAFVALAQLPEDVRLYLQGNPPHDGGRVLWARARELGIADRVILKGPFAPGTAVYEAASHTVGLCLERRGPANHEYTVSNKMFDYMMAGLAVVSADLPSLRRVIERSGGGELFHPGSPESLVAVLRRLREDPRRTAMLGQRARAFALAQANDETDMARFIAAFERICRGVPALAAHGPESAS
jgi:glycosyltransferase involved in cell wall biosynthesis